VRRETGVKVRCNEGVAIHVGPEPCVYRSRGRDAKRRVCGRVAEIRSL
jgi:hypothetical protein